MAERPQMRPDPAKEMSSRERAEQVADAFFEHGGFDDGPGTDEFYFPRDQVPDGWTYEWKREITGGDDDPAYQVQLARGGWRPVPVDRHPEMMPQGFDGKKITRKGMLLMERPASITEAMRKREQLMARNQVKVKEEQLTQPAPGQFERENKGAPLVSVKKSFAPIPIPE